MVASDSTISAAFITINHELILWSKVQECGGTGTQSFEMPTLSAS
jgi:hypothetical protein